MATKILLRARASRRRAPTSASPAARRRPSTSAPPTCIESWLARRDPSLENTTVDAGRSAAERAAMRCRELILRARDLWSRADTHRIVGARSLQPRPQFAAMLLVALTVTAAHIAPCADDACIRRAPPPTARSRSPASPASRRRRKAALSAWARCASARRPSGARDVVLDDGTLRRTVGARTLRSSREPVAAAGCASSRRPPSRSRGWSRRRRARAARGGAAARAQRLGADALRAGGRRRAARAPPPLRAAARADVVVVVVGGGGRPGAVGRADGAAGAQAAHRRRPLHRARPRAVAPPGRFG